MDYAVAIEDFWAFSKGQLIGSPEGAITPGAIFPGSFSRASLNFPTLFFCETPEQGT